MGSGFAIIHQIPPMLGPLHFCRISCSPYERLCASRSPAEVCVVDFIVAAVYSLLDSTSPFHVGSSRNGARDKREERDSHNV